jgi:hypothetical protein
MSKIAERRDAFAVLTPPPSPSEIDCLMSPQSRKRVLGITQSNSSRVIYLPHMNKEKPTVISPRVYKKHRDIIKRAARKLRVSDAEVVRRAIEAFVRTI